MSIEFATKSSAALSKWKRYPKYRGSGVEWLGEIPAGWEVRKMKHIAKVNLSNVDKKKNEGEISVKLCNYVDVYYNDCITSDFNFMEATATPNQIDKFTLRKGDVIITKDSESWEDIAVPAYVPFDLDGVICGYHLAHIHPNNTIIDGRYLFRSLNANSLNYKFRVESNGITRFGLGKYWIDNSPFIVPPIVEQRIIVSFLDRKTAHIDTLISKKECLIALLEEKRAALISRVVTKGLEPDVPMKDSGVEWLGEVPVGWEVKRLRYVCKLNPVKSEISNIPSDFEVSFLPMELIGEDGTLSLDEIRRIEQVFQGYTYFQEDDVIVAKITPCFENGKGAICTDLINGIGFGTTELHVLRAQKLSYPQYIFYLTRSNPFRSIGTAMMHGSAGQQRVPEDFIKDFRLGFPSLQEQRAIAEYLDHETIKIDTLKAKIREHIEKVKEYRTALISAAVTGKIDVREATA